MTLHGVTWRYMALHGVTWRYMALHGFNINSCKFISPYGTSLADSTKEAKKSFFVSLQAQQLSIAETIAAAAVGQMPKALLRLFLLQH
jgi:hypothetical protein